MADLAKIADELSTLTVIEASELSKMLEERWGVSAAAPVAVAAAPGAAPAAEEAEEQIEFTVVLTSFGEKKINVIKEVRALTGLGLRRPRRWSRACRTRSRKTCPRKTRARSRSSSKLPARPSRSSSDDWLSPAHARTRAG